MHEEVMSHDQIRKGNAQHCLVANSCTSLPSPPLPSPPLKDVFTVSVGNLPPGANVLIKITYVAELSVEGENIVFTLPGSVAPWKQEAALEETTQTDVEKIKVKQQG